MNLFKFTCHNSAFEKPTYYLAWFPESEPDGIVWGPCLSEFIRDDVARRIQARDTFLRLQEKTGTTDLPDAQYVREKGLSHYR